MIHNNDSYNERLLPCPFCGEKPIWYLEGDAELVGKKRLIVIKCPNCDTRQETAVLHLSTKIGCLVAETKWNTRSGEDE